MKRIRFTEEQIIAVLREHEAGAKTADLARKHGISEATLYNWKAKYGDMDVSDAKRLRALEDENRKLKKLLAKLTDFSEADKRGFRHKAGLGVGEVDGQFARRQIRLIKGQVDDRRPDLIRDLVPDPLRVVWACRPPEPRSPRPDIGRTSRRTSIWIPIDARVRQTDKVDCSTSSMISSFSDAEYLMKRSAGRVATDPPDLLWSRCYRPVSANGRLCRSHPQWRKPADLPVQGPTKYELVTVSSRKGIGTRRATVPARPRRRGD